MCEEVKKYREKLERLEMANQEVQKQIFSLVCQIDGFLQAMDEYDISDVERKQSLKRLKERLSVSEISVEEENVCIVFIENLSSERPEGVLECKEFNIEKILITLMQIEKQLVCQKTVKIEVVQDLMHAVCELAEAVTDYTI